MAGTVRAEGLRERKKRQTRQHISDVATGLFMERSFDAVTIAEVAEAAEVSVNTVYNYFPAKEDLFFDREDAVVDRLAAMVRGRRMGESAARAVLRGLRDDLVAVSPSIGLTEGYAAFATVVRESPALVARLHLIQQRAVDAVEQALREESGTGPGDAMPELVAGQLGWLNGTVVSGVRRAMSEGLRPAEASRAVLDKLDQVEELLGEKVLNYAVRSAE
ncbi:TetR/AcrR family transcriptional regulator [Streptomyces sp. 8N706]|uniref:TetR/AcrR family transcriptional regulator n=1 Tax=Streptomyces sp. 8N706 TaxID=3457416 RepID=UPI003FCF8D01